MLKCTEWLFGFLLLVWPLVWRHGYFFCNVYSVVLCTEQEQKHVCVHGENIVCNRNNSRCANSAAVPLDNFSSLHLHNQGNVWYIEINFMLQYCSVWAKQLHKVVPVFWRFIKTVETYNKAMNIFFKLFFIIRLYSDQHWRSDSNMCCSLWIILT